MKTNVLFVDDHSRVLEGLRRSLRSQRNIWDMNFSTSGKEALDIINQKEIDVIVSDMRMPEMDGAALLESVEKKSPQTVRIILSGQCDRETVFRSVGPSHQYLSKPCDSDTIVKVISRALTLRERLSRPELRSLVAKSRVLPSSPAKFHAINQLLANEDVSVESISNIISKDIGLSAKLIQLSNSNYFGSHNPCCDIYQVVSRIGVDTIRTLILSCEISEQFNIDRLAWFPIDQMHFQNLQCAVLAAQILEAEDLDKPIVKEAFMAGFLHNIGIIILAAGLREEYAAVISSAVEHGQDLVLAEESALGAGHTDVGAYLLALWGHSEAVIEAAAYYHTPESSEYADSPVLMAVHVAKALLQKAYEGKKIYFSEVHLNHEYLKGMGLHDKIPQWEEMALKIVNAGAQ